MKGMIVAPQPIAVEEGAQVLAQGGNAIDAAVVSALVQGIVSPQMCGIGGYVILTAHLATRADAGPRGLDAPALAGSKVAPDMWTDALIRPNPDGWGYFMRGKVNDIGYTSVCTPGTVRALSTMLDRWGTLPWESALAPAARIAEEGFVVDGHLGMGWKADRAYPAACSLLDRIEANAEARRIYLQADGRPYQVGETLRNPDYARTLRHLAERGADDFYHGELAARIGADLAAHGSYVTADDLATYRARDVSPVVGTYRGYTVVTSPPPHGGPTLIAMLNILEHYDLAGMTPNSAEYIYLVSQAMKAAFADRNQHLGDAEFVDVPLAWMTSKERAAEWQRVIDADERIQVSFAATEPPDTTHVSVTDRWGNGVALTHSLGSSSGVITPGLGFMYNDSMVNFHPLPGHVNSILPRKSRTTGMTPTIVYRGDKPVLVVGAPGATRIITSVAQVMLNVLDHGMDVDRAVHAPRFDCQGDLIKCQARIPEFVCAQVRTKHPIVRIPYSHGGLALVHAIHIDPDTGTVAGGADTGAGGMALEV